VTASVGRASALSSGHVFVTHNWHLLLYPAAWGLVRGS